MDIERRRQEAALGADRKPRLMEESELPPFLTQVDMDDMEDEEVKEIELGRGNRMRKETNYDDRLSERDWLKAIGAEEEDFEDDEDEVPVKKPDKGKRGRKKRGLEEDEEEEGDPRKKKKKGSSKKLQKKMRKLMDVVMMYEDQDGRVLSDPFIKLPTRRELPDYYEIIKKPVDITKILNKIDEGKFEDFDALERDFMLLCSNTQKYNEDGSLIHEDSIVLQSVFTNAREKLTKEWEENDDNDDDDVEEDEPITPSSSRAKKKRKEKSEAKGRKRKSKKYYSDDDLDDDDDDDM